MLSDRKLNPLLAEESLLGYNVGALVCLEVYVLCMYWFLPAWLVSV